MKDLILERLDKHVEELIKKDFLSTEEVNFLVFWLQRIEYKENEEKAKALKAESNEQWKQSMLSMIDSFSYGRD